MKAAAFVVLSAIVAFGACSSKSPVQPDESATAASPGASGLRQAAPVRTNLVIPPFYGNAAGAPLTPDDDPSTLVYKIRNPVGAPIGPFAVTAPDGHHVTLGEYVTVHGRASIKCVPNGTHTVLHLSGLLPNGVYTIWNVIPNAAGAPPVAVGSLGLPDGSQNTFYASASGEGQISGFTLGGPMSVRGIFPSCGLEADPELHVVGAYHFDNQTHGTGPGPADKFIEQFVFIFAP